MLPPSHPPPHFSLQRRLVSMSQPLVKKMPFTLNLGAACASTAPATSRAPGDGRLVIKFLHAPKHDQKISKEKQRPGLSKRPVKFTPKPQFSTKAIGQMPGVVDHESEANPLTRDARLPDSPFVAWLKAGHANRPETQNVRNYLMRGPPFLGTHYTAAKGEIRDAGAVWCKNPAHKEGRSGRGIPYGWYAAPNERVLVHLLEMKPILHTGGGGGRRNCDVDYVSPWDPKAVDGTDRGAELRCNWQQSSLFVSGEMILQLLAEHAFYAERVAREDRDNAQAAAEERENLRRARDIAAGRTADGMAEIDRLQTEYGVTWSATLAHAAARSEVLGPASGISAVERVLRALDLGVVEKVDVCAHRFVDQCKKDAVKGALLNSNQVDDALAKDYNWESPAAPVLMFGRNHPWTIALPTEAELARSRKDHYMNCDPCATGRQVPPSRTTYCERCNEVVLVQFGDCACGEEVGGRWEMCPTCRAMCHVGNPGGQQSCACADEEQWQRTQLVLCTKAERIQAERFESGAYRDAMGHIDGDGDDDPSVGASVTEGVGGGRVGGGAVEGHCRSPCGVMGTMDGWLGNV